MWFWYLRIYIRYVGLKAKVRLVIKNTEFTMGFKDKINSGIIIVVKDLNC